VRIAVSLVGTGSMGSSEVLGIRDLPEVPGGHAAGLSSYLDVLEKVGGFILRGGPMTEGLSISGGWHDAESWVSYQVAFDPSHKFSRFAYSDLAVGPDGIDGTVARNVSGEDELRNGRARCGSHGVVGRCSEGHAVQARMMCGREWCPDCGGHNGPAHKKRLARSWPKVWGLIRGKVGRNPAGSGVLVRWIFTLPLAVRWQFADRKRLDAWWAKIRELMKASGYRVGLSAVHWFGDGLCPDCGGKVSHSRSGGYRCKPEGRAGCGWVGDAPVPDTTFNPHFEVLTQGEGQADLAPVKVAYEKWVCRVTGYRGPWGKNPWVHFYQPAGPGVSPGDCETDRVSDAEFAFLITYIYRPTILAAHVRAHPWLPRLLHGCHYQRPWGRWSEDEKDSGPAKSETGPAAAPTVADARVSEGCCPDCNRILKYGGLALFQGVRHGPSAEWWCRYVDPMMHAGPGALPGVPVADRGGPAVRRARAAWVARGCRRGRSGQGKSGAVGKMAGGAGTGV